MDFLEKIVFFFIISPILCFSDETTFNYSLLVQFPEIREDDAQLHCTSWRVAAEANNLSPWKTIPYECVDYVKDYMMGKGYEVDLERVSNESVSYARILDLGGDGRDVWIFDIDETLLSNLPYYAAHGYGSEIFNSTIFDQWVEMGTAPAIRSSLKLYEEVLRLGFKVIFLTGRSERHRKVTVDNLLNAGFEKWDRLILRSLEVHGITATMYKSDKRRMIVEEGYRIMGNSGDQWSDIMGSSMSSRSFKLPNPMYYIP